MSEWRFYESFEDVENFVGGKTTRFSAKCFGKKTKAKKKTKKTKTKKTKTKKKANQLTFGFPEAPLPPPKKAKPIVKWLGGKKWIINLCAHGIYTRLCQTGGRYIEPFLGGGALALHLGLPNMIVADLCAPLIQTYQAVRDEPSVVAWAVSALAAEGVDKETYYRVRDSFNEARDDLIKLAAQFIYLNKTGYNGLYRENKKGGFNVPYGDQAYRKSVVKRRSNDSVESLFPSARRLHDLSVAFATTDLTVSDFRDTIAKAKKGDVIFSDPPYAKTYNGYTKDGFGPNDQRDLAALLAAAHKRGAIIISTNADQDEIRDLYSWATVMSTAEARSVSRDGKQRRRKDCVLVISPGDEALLGT